MTPTPPAPTPPPAEKTDLEKARDEFVAAGAALDDVRGKYNDDHPEVQKAKRRYADAQAALDRLLPPSNTKLRDLKDPFATDLRDPFGDEASKAAPKKPVKKSTAAKTTAKTGAGSAAGSAAAPPAQTPPPTDDKIDRTKQLVGPKPAG